MKSDLNILIIWATVVGTSIAWTLLSLINGSALGVLFHMVLLGVSLWVVMDIRGDIVSDYDEQEDCDEQATTQE